MKHRVKQDKPVSVEVLKLLGVPFTWGSFTLAGKFVHGENGPELWARSIGPKYLLFSNEWEPAERELGFIPHVKDIKLYLVELDDELEASDAPDR